MSHAPSSTLRRRHAELRHAMSGLGLEALVVTALPNILYLTNFDGSSAILVAVADGLSFLTDSRYLTALTSSRDGPTACPDMDLVAVEGSYDAALAAHLRRLSLPRVGFEASHMSVTRHAGLMKILSDSGASSELVATDGIVERMRQIKDEHELSVLREGARRISAVADQIVQEVRVGRNEREIALAIDWSIRQAGFSHSAFDTIVASGPLAALPHARPSERTISEGDMVLLDFGGVYDSYCVDLTRTVSMGRASERARDVYAAVLEAHDRAISAAGPGRSRFDVDAAARETLRVAGFAEAFGHGTGHGIGLEIHEDPRITQRRPDVNTQHEDLEEGMVFTIEPGAYFPGWGGVRIEDDVVVTRTGVEVLTTPTTALLEL